MNRLTIALWLMIGSLLPATGVVADTVGAGHELPGSFSHEFTSTIIGDSFSVVVSVPFNYARTDRKYPLMFALDGDGMFGMASDIPKLLSFEGKVPPMIVATVVYGSMQKWFQKRARDFHSKDGGAEKFLMAVRDEIIPFLEANYRIDAADRALYGHSSAGLFAVYTAVKEPQLFNRVLATSPSLEEEPVWTATFSEMISGNRDGFPKIYMSVDASETAMAAVVKPFAEMLSKRTDESRFKFEVLNEGSHMSVIPKAYNNGLYFLYAN